MKYTFIILLLLLGACGKKKAAEPLTPIPGNVTWGPSGTADDYCNASGTVCGVLPYTSNCGAGDPDEAAYLDTSNASIVGLGIIIGPNNSINQISPSYTFTFDGSLIHLSNGHTWTWTQIDTTHAMVGYSSLCNFKFTKM